MKKVEVPVSNIHTLDDYFEEKEMEIIRSKLSIMDYQPSKANAKENAPLSDQKEDILIHEGEILLDKFNKPLKPAFPASDDIIESDKHELKTAITALEKIDKDHYQSDEYEQIDMGKGMLYDSISRKLNKIIKTNNMKELLFVQAEKIENEAFNVVKHLEHDDFLETLKLMKEVGTIKEIIEINPQTNLLILSKNTIRLSIAEKVVISFIANSDKHSLDDLKELTGWKPLFTNQIIEKLQEKSILSIENKILKISGLLTSKERNDRDEKLKQVKVKKELKNKKIEELANENKKDETPLIDEKVGIKKEEKKKQASISIKKEKAIQDELKDLGDDIQKAEEIIEDKNEKEREQGIMISIGKILKDLESTTGGLITLFALQYYLNQGDFPNLKKFELLGVIDTLKENQVILDEISFSGVNIYLYEDLVFDEEMKKLLRNFVTHGEMDMEDIEAATDWDDEKTKRVLKRFYDQKILKMNEKKLFFIPGLFNTK